MAMSNTNNQQSNFNQLCETYGLTKIGENSQEVFIACSRPYPALEPIINKMTGKNVCWQIADQFTDFHQSVDNITPPHKPMVIDKILNSLINASLNTGASKIRLEPGSKDYRWRVYDRFGWHTLQVLPTDSGEQLSNFISDKIGLEKINSPQHELFKFKDWQFKCSLQPVWLGTVIQMDLINDTVDNPEEIVNYFSQPDFSHLVIVGQRQHRHNHTIAQQFENLSKKFDTVTLGEKVGLNEVVIKFPDTTTELQKIIKHAPEIVIINHHDLVETTKLAKVLQDNDIKTITYITSHSPWPVLAALNEHDFKHDALIVKLSGEKICEQCKKTVHPDKRISFHTESGHDGWLKNDIWENQFCKLNHADHDFQVVINEDTNNIGTIIKKLVDHIDQLILQGEIALNSKDKFLQDKDSVYFNF